MNKSAASQDSGDTVTHMDLLKKFKRFNPLEPSLGIVGFFLIVVLFVSCFFYLDYGAVARGLRFRGITLLGLHFSSISSPSPLGGDARVEFLEEEGDRCDVFDGNWVWDENYPLYQSTNCSFLDQGFRCSENGRPDSFYTKWRWQPKICNLPRFLYCLFFFPLCFQMSILVAKKMKENNKTIYYCFFYMKCLANAVLLNTK